MSELLMAPAFVPLLLLLLEHLFSLLEHFRLLLLRGRSRKASLWSIRTHIKDSNKVNRIKRRVESILESFFEERAKQFSSRELGL